MPALIEERDELFLGEYIEPISLPSGVATQAG